MAILGEVQNLPVPASNAFKVKPDTVAKTEKKEAIFKIQAPPPVQTSQPAQDTAQLTPTPTETQRALELVEKTYTDLKAAVDIKKMEPAKIEDYIRAAEKRKGVPYPDEQKELFRMIIAKGDHDDLVLLALELGVGVPKKQQAKALESLGLLVIHRDNVDALKAFLQQDKDPNLKAYVETMVMMNRVENALERYHRLKRKYNSLKQKFAQWGSLGGLLPVFGNANPQ